jgi:hypothetical protein
MYEKAGAEEFYEIQVAIVERRIATVVVHLRADSDAEAHRRALQATSDLCAKANSPFGLSMSDWDFEHDGFETEGIEGTRLVGQNETPEWKKPEIDLKDQPTDAEISSAKGDNQPPLPFDQ